MISIYPTWYDDFQCKADRCEHTCCQTWEIDIDPASYARYRELTGPLGERLRASIAGEGDHHYFALNEQGYCPLLEASGLCSLVLAKGEDYLCDICHHHPRFYGYVKDGTDRTIELAGVGLACEKTCELLSAPVMSLEKSVCVPTSDTGISNLVGAMDAPNEDTLYLTVGEEHKIYGYTTVDRLLAQLGIDCTKEDMAFVPLPNEADYLMLLSILETTEPIHQAWTEGLSWLTAHIRDVVARAEHYQTVYDSALFQRLYQYIIYRHIPRLADVSLEALLAYGRDSAEYIFMMAAVHGNELVQMARWSEQIEYDTDNVARLLGIYESMFS